MRGGGGGGGGGTLKLAYRVRLCPICLFNYGVLGIKNLIAKCNGCFFKF